MSQLEVDKIIPQSGTTLTIGDSGDTVNFADGTALSIDTNTLFIDSTNNRVGIGTSSPSSLLHLSSNGPVIKLTDTDTGATHNLSGSSSARNFDLEVDTGSTSGSPRFALKIHDGLYYTQTKTEAVFNEESNDVDFRVESNGNSSMLFVDGGNDKVGIGTTSPSEKLEVDGTVKATQFVGGGLNPFRNIIINGDMSIAQRSTSASSVTASGYHSCDRWQSSIGTMGTWTQSQSTDVPTGSGFRTSLKMDCTTADASPASGDVLVFAQYIEGQNLQYLKKGTSSAESVTCSFWVKSNKTGTYILELKDDNNRTINKSYTVSSANTWEKKTITYEGDTSGTIDNDNGTGLELNFWLGAGSSLTSGTLQTSWGSKVNANRAVGQVNLADNTANEWYVTGVQLEAGSVASDFEFLPVDVNLARCQRYYQIIADRTSTGERMAIICGAAIATGTGSGVVYAAIQFPTPMRASATMLSTTVTNGYRLLGDTQPTFNVLSAGPITNRGARLSNGGTLSSNATSGKAYVLECELNGSNLIFSSEL